MARFERIGTWIRRLANAGRVPESVAEADVAPADPFDLATSIELARHSTRDRLAFAALFALVSLSILDWRAMGAWLAAVAIWELALRPRLDGRVMRLPPGRGLAVYAIVNLIGAGLFAGLPYLALSQGSPIGVAIGATWIVGGLLSIFVYFGGSRPILWSVLTPTLVATLAGPFAAYGATPASAIVSGLILAGGLSVRGYALDRRALARTLSDRQAAYSDMERKLAVAIEASGDGLFELDLVRDRGRVSATWARMLGYDPEELAGWRSDWRAFVHPDELPRIDAAYAEHFRGETPHTLIEHRMLCKDGSSKWVLARGRLVERTPTGQPGRIVGTTMDLSARKALEQQLEAARDAAEAANQAKSAFLANMSHEIRTPLNGVIGTAGALSRRPLPPQEREMVSLIQASGQVLDRLLSDILDQAKIEAGRFELSIAPFDLRHEIETAAELMRARADEKGVAFRVAYSAEARGLFEGDAVRLRQVVSNLASNAIKFTERGGVGIAVEVEDPPQPGAASVLAVAVTDTGIGMEAEVVTRLFTRFTQADGSISRQFGGTGLGLAICKTLVELMGGEISARSEPGSGSTFTLRIPLRRAVSLAEYDALSAEPPSGAPEPDGEPLDVLRVLLAEDHPTNQRVVQLILEPAGVELTVVGNGAEALEAFRPGLFDLILMDMQMPVMDGLSATAAIRAREAAAGVAPMAIAMLTANAMPEHAERAAAAGADHLIAKPVTPDSLVEGIRVTLGKAAAADASGARTGTEQP